MTVSKVVVIPVDRISDWATFHEVFKQAMGFPDFYGRNMNAWIDCMTSVDAPEDGMSALTVQPGELFVLQIDEPFIFQAVPGTIRRRDRMLGIREQSSSGSWGASSVGTSSQRPVILRHVCEDVGN